MRKTTDLLPSAPWRRQSLGAETRGVPGSGPSNPSPATSKYSLRKPMRMPSADSRSSMASNSLRRMRRIPSTDESKSMASGANSLLKMRRRSKGLFKFRSNKGPRSATVDARPSEEGMTDPDLESDDIILDELARSLGMTATEEADGGNNDSEENNGPKNKDLRKSLTLQQIFSSRFNISTSSRQGFSRRPSKGSGNNSSMMSSISSAFSSIRSMRNVFVFTASDSDRHLAEMEGHCFPEFLSEDSLEDRLDPGSDQLDPPRYPSRRDSGSCDGIPRYPGRQESRTTMIEAIEEMDQELDASALFTVLGVSAEDNTYGDRCHVRTSRGETNSLSFLRIGDAGALSQEEFNPKEILKTTSTGLRGSGTTCTTFMSSETLAFPVPREQGLRCSGTTCTSVVSFSEEFAAPARREPAMRGSGTSFMSSSEALPFPVRRESIASCATGTSQSCLSIGHSWRRSSKVPESVPPEATFMEKKEYLKRKLTFAKQELSPTLVLIVPKYSEVDR